MSTTHDPYVSAIKAIATSERAVQLLEAVDPESETLAKMIAQVNNLRALMEATTKNETLFTFRQLSLATADLNLLSRHAFTEAKNHDHAIYGTGGPIEPHDPSACSLI